MSGGGEDTGSPTTSDGVDTSDSGMRFDLASTPDLPTFPCALPDAPNAAVTGHVEGAVAADFQLEYAWYAVDDAENFRVILTPTVQVFVDGTSSFGYNSALGISLMATDDTPPSPASYCYEQTISVSTTSLAQGWIILDAVPGPGEPLLGAVMADEADLELSGTFRAIECPDLPRTPCD